MKKWEQCVQISRLQMKQTAPSLMWQNEGQRAAEWEPSWAGAPHRSQVRGGLGSGLPEQEVQNDLCEGEVQGISHACVSS